MLVIGHFALPFFALISRGAKRNRLSLAAASLWMLLMHYVDLYWLIMPSAGDLRPHPLDATTLVAVGGFFVGIVAWLARKPKLVPARDPRLAESVAFENL